MYKLDLPLDTRESIAIERRRNMERQRQSRVFNVRQRTIGVDVDELDKQVKDKKEKQEEENLLNLAVAGEMIRDSKIGEILQNRKEKEVKELNKSLTEYWHENQRPQDRREFDLNDPESKLKDLPARVSDDDPRMTISGMQAFSGEDLHKKSRKSLQEEQTRSWLSEQISEKNRLSMEQKKADELHDLKAIEMDQRAEELSRADEMTRKTLNMAIRDYNQALAKEKESLKQQAFVQEQDDNFTEMSNHIHGDVLTENPMVSQSAFGQHRWKGMSQAQIDDVLQMQAAQREEKKCIDTEEKNIENEWDRRRLAEAKAGLVIEAQKKATKDQILKDLAEQNKQLAAEQRAKQEVMNKEVYVNSLSGDYFAQFGTSSR